jgi:hypothetical protein
LALAVWVLLALAVWVLLALEYEWKDRNHPEYFRGLPDGG